MNTVLIVFNQKKCIRGKLVILEFKILFFVFIISKPKISWLNQNSNCFSECLLRVLSFKESWQLHNNLNRIYSFIKWLKIPTNILIVIISAFNLH
jgi:hypothetical protein